MKESALYSKFKKAYLKLDPKAWIYKIPDTGGTGGKRPADIIMISRGVPFLIEFKLDNKPTKYQSYQLRLFIVAGGFSELFNNSTDNLNGFCAFINLMSISQERTNNENLHLTRRVG